MIDEGCTHPITFDENLDLPFYGLAWIRECAMCGTGYNRSERVLDPLRRRCERAWSINFRRVSDALRDEGPYRDEDWVP